MKGTRDKGKGKLELSLWDFAGQHDYYNNHHYFLSTRTVFMVLWRMSDGEKGYEGLEFWFRSLAAHLSSSSKGTGTYYSVIVVGTFLDAVKEDAHDAREHRVKEIAHECQFFAPLQYLEVSCSASSSPPLQNIDQLKTVITTTALSHSYMGERIPQSYLLIQGYCRQLKIRKERAEELPICT